MIKSSVNIHSWSYFAVLTIIAVSIPLSKYVMSIGAFLLLLMWLLSGFSFTISARFFKLGGYFTGFFHLIAYVFSLAYNNFFEKFSLFFKNKAAVVLASIYVLHVVGLIYTEDFAYALKDLRVKLPLLFFPVILSTMEAFKYRRVRVLFLFYVASVLAGTFISFYFILKGNFIDIRDISPFVGSIRFGLNVSFSFFILVYFVGFDKKIKKWYKVLFILMSAWFVVFLVLMESVTSLSIILIIGISYLVYLLLQTEYVTLKIAIVVLVIGIPTALFFYINSVIEEALQPPAIEFATLETKTAKGNLYRHDTVNRGIEDGKYIGIYLCEKELEAGWNKRSTIPYRSKTEGGHDVNETLIRYLTSKDLRKDEDGVNALSDWDVKMIENGVANVNYVTNPGLRVRILKILMGYQVYLKTGDPSGSSVMQRIEYSKGSINLIKECFWTGVGTGDIEDSLYDQYREMKSGLKSEFMFHAHNQYFAILITFGVFGFIWFLFALIYPPLKLARFNDYFFLTFFLIFILSMFSDDTLETQAGVTLSAFFYSFLLFGKKRENE